MLPFGLVLLFATSALAAPSIGITAVPFNQYTPQPDRGGWVSGNTLERAFEIVDGGETNIYTTAFQNAFYGLGNLNDPDSQALAASQGLATLGELIPGTPGDSCEAAALVDAYAQAAPTGNWGLVRGPLISYINRMQVNLDFIAQLAAGNNNLRFVTGPKGNCRNGGKIYNFEGAWDGILGSGNPYNAQLLNEQYCSARRLYNALDTRSNNVGASVTAASIAPVTNVIKQAIGPISNVLRIVANGGNAFAAVNVAKAALRNAAANY